MPLPLFFGQPTLTELFHVLGQVVYKPPHSTSQPLFAVVLLWILGAVIHLLNLLQ
jgi:hypothetical protein